MPEFICTSCDYRGEKGKIKQGSFAIEMFLWFLFPIGPIYSIWRHMLGGQGCPKCNEKKMVQAAHDDFSDISPENLKNMPDRWSEDRERYNNMDESEKERLRKIGEDLRKL